MGSKESVSDLIPWSDLLCLSGSNDGSTKTYLLLMPGESGK